MRISDYIVVLDCQTHFVATVNASAAVRKSDNPEEWGDQKKDVADKLAGIIEAWACDND